MASSVPTVTAHVTDAEPYALVIVGDRSYRQRLESLVTIGRAEDCGIRIDDSSVSRYHARLEVGIAGGTVEDLGSHNGTRLDGKPVVGKQRVSSGDVLVLGEVTLVLYLARQQRYRPELAGDIYDRLESEVDRSLRYDGTLSLIVWRPGSTASPSLLSSLLRRCDVIGLGPDGELVGIFPELDDDEADTLAHRALDLLRAVTPDVRVAFAQLPKDGMDAATLVAATRDALQAGVVRADQAGQRIEIDGATVLVADSGMLRTYDLLRRLAASDIPILVCGETGVGKEVVARSIHAFSPRKAGPFVAVNCAALPHNLIESELFGYKRGAFTGADRDKPGVFEAADGGTLFLDEIGELPLAAQAKLLRAVDTRTVTRLGDNEPRTVDLRFVIATNRELPAEVAAERFRADLYYRLSSAVVLVPPLRDRPREVPLLAREFLARARARLGRSPIEISDQAMRVLAGRSYPGNVRELANAMEYVAAVVDGELVEPWHVPAEANATPLAPTERGGNFRPIDEEVAELERRRMKEALAARQGNQTQAADLIAMPRRTFVTKMRRYGLRG